MGRGRRDKVHLSPEQRQKLEDISRNGYAPAKKILPAQILLMCDEGIEANRKWTDEEIAVALNLHRHTVARIRKRFLEKGEQPALNRTHRKTPPVPAKLDGHMEAQVIALCCSQPPVGQVHWSLRLLTQELKTRGIITEISRRKIKLLCDHLNTHDLASLYEAFPADEAHRLARRLEIYHTPRNGSWLNVAEIELSVLAQQCLDRRIPCVEKLSTELTAWQKERNRTTSKVVWQFTTVDARIKLKHLYPVFETSESEDSNAPF